LVDYFDADPCKQEPEFLYDRSETASARGFTATQETNSSKKKYTAEELGIKIEESFAIGEYSIEVLSAEHSTTNYRTVPIPTDIEVPEYIEDQFPKFYKATFDKMVNQDSMKNVYTEYFWNLNATCDPCTGELYTKNELDELGVNWLVDVGDDFNRYKNLSANVFITPLHLRYTNSSFPEDLVFQETGDTHFSQGRYVIHHPYPWKGDVEQCSCAKEYLNKLKLRQEKWTDNLKLGDIFCRKL
jgi:hypothetical protein